MLRLPPFFDRLSLAPKFGLVFGALALLGLAGFGSMVWLLLASRADAHVINLAGRQRMLIERMAKEAAEMSMPDFADTGAADDLRAAADDFERTFTGLLEGDAALGLPALKDPEARAAAERLRAQWLPFRAAVETLLETSEVSATSEVSDSHMQAAHRILTAEDGLLDAADELVTLLQIQAERRVAGLWQFGLFMGGLLVLCVAAGAAVVERDVSRPLRRLARAAQSMAGGDLGAGSALPIRWRDEIGRLTQAFNDMADTLDEAFAAMRQANHQLSALNAVGAAASESLDVEHMLDAALEAGLSAVGLEIGSVALLDEAGEALVMRVHRGLPPEIVEAAARIPLGEQISGRVAESGEPVIIQDFSSDPRAVLPAERASGLYCFASVPIKNRGRMLGVLNAAGRERRVLGGAELELLSAVSASIGAAVQNALEYEAVARRASELQALTEVGGLVTAGGDLQSTLDLVAAKVAQAAGFEGVDIALEDPATGEVCVQALHSTILLGLLEGRKGTRFPPSAAPIYQELQRERRPIVLDDPQHDPRVRESQRELCRRDGVQSVIVMPLLFGERLIGALDLISTRPRCFASEARLLNVLASQVSAVVVNARLFDETQRQFTLADSLRRAGAVLSASLSQDEVFDSILEQLARVTPYDSANLMLIEDGHAGVVRQRGYEAYGLDQAILRVRLPIAEMPTFDHMARTGRPHIVSDTGADPGWAVVNAARHVRSWAGAPLVVRGEAIGFFSLDSTQPGFYTPAHAEALAAFANQAAIAIGNARLYAEAERRTRQLHTLHAASHVLAGMLDLDSVLETLVESARRLAAARYGALAIHENGALAHFAAAGLTPEERAHITHLPSGRGLLGVVLREGHTLRLDDLTRDPRAAGFPPGHPPMKTLLAAPIAMHGETLGTLYVTEKEAGGHFTAEDEAMLTALAADAALALENARLYGEAQARLTELQSLFEVSESLARADSLDDILQVVADRARASLPLAEKAVIHLIDPAQGTLVARAVSGAVEQRRSTGGFRLNEGIVGRAIRERRTVYVPDVRADPDFMGSAASTRSLVVVPLMVGNEAVGTLTLASASPSSLIRANFGVSASDLTPPAPLPEAGRGESAPPSPPVSGGGRRGIGDEGGEVLGALSVHSQQPHAFGEDNMNLIESLAHQAAVAVKKAQVTDSLRESLALVELRSLDLEASLAQLQAAQTQLIQAGKLASLGTLSAGIAHELNNPLAGIKTYAQNLLRFQHKGRLTEPVLAENVSAINALADKASRIIQHFRAFSRQSSGKFEPVNLNLPLEEALSMLSEQLRLRDIAVIKDLAADLPPVRGDANQLEQVLLNLIGNARDAMVASARKELRLRTYPTTADGRPQTAVGGQRSAVAAAVGSPPLAVVVEVADSGCGIPPEHLNKIFDPFFTTKEVGQGTGLGLSISHGIVENHGGHIEVESAPGEGTTFRMVLPVASGQ